MADNSRNDTNATAAVSRNIGGAALAPMPTTKEHARQRVGEVRRSSRVAAQDCATAPNCPMGGEHPIGVERIAGMGPTIPSAVKAAARRQISEERRKGLKRNGQQISLVPPCSG